MFSENDIIVHCRECGGDCESVTNCPFRVILPDNRKSRLFSSLPADWKSSSHVLCLSGEAGDMHPTRKLVSGLTKLNTFFLQ